jgi:hypothetical protein
MPNWCDNEMTISHADKAMIEKAKLSWNSGKFLSSLIPIPEELMNTVAGFVGGDEQKELEKKQKANLEKYGYANWYDYAVNEWGTKWDFGYNQDEGNEIFEEDDHIFSVSFLSAWSPPIQAYDKLQQLGFRIHAYYFEGGMGFAGEYENGEDRYYNNWRSAPDEVIIKFSIDEYYESMEQ